MTYVCLSVCLSVCNAVVDCDRTKKWKSAHGRIGRVSWLTACRRITEVDLLGREKCGILLFGGNNVRNGRLQAIRGKSI